MNEHPPHLDRETAEQLLGSAGATHGAGVEALAGLLRSAAAPGRTHELSGEEDAVMAFRAMPVAVRRWSKLRRLLTFKVAAITAVITAGGLAFASTAGILPAPFENKPDPIPSSAPPHPPTSAPVQPSASSTPRAHSEQQLSGLCNAYLSKPPDQRGKMLESSAFSALVSAAGGADQVDAFCTGMPEKKADRSKSPRAHQ